MRKIKYLLVMVPFFFMNCNSTDFKAQQLTLELDGNPTTGYTWIYEVKDDSVIQIQEDIKYLGTEKITGAPSKFIYTITSLKPGSTKLHFEYKRPWEEKPADRAITYSVTVNSNGKLLLEKQDKEVTMKNGFKSISMAEGLSLYNSDDTSILLDVRRTDEYSEEHIPGAVLHTNELMTKENTENLLKDRNQTIYVYCRSGRRSKEASQKLVNYGYTNIIEIGGILDYSGPTEKGE